MAKHKIAFFSTGIPDIAQGGSGIFNYYVIDELLNCGYHVDAFLRVNDNFLKKHTTDGYLRELLGKGLSIKLIQESTNLPRGLFGFNLLAATHQLQLSERIVEKVFSGEEKYLAVIAHDLGWAMALKNIKLPVVAVIGDPLHSRLMYARPFEFIKIRSWLNYLRAKSLSTKSVYREIASRTNKKMILGSLSPHHANEFQENGIECIHIQWFSPEVVAPAKEFKLHNNDLRESFKLLHVGALESTASDAMVRYWSDHILPELATLPFTIEIRFVGRIGKPFFQNKGNLKFTFLGHVEDLQSEFFECDAFFSPMKYPVGVRTRILSALSYGVPVIADPSISFGLPELVDKQHVFLGNTATEIAQLISFIRLNPCVSRRVGESGRKIWEKHFSPRKNSKKIIRLAGLN